MHAASLPAPRCSSAPDAMFVAGARQNTVVALVCGLCPLRRRCLLDTLTVRPTEGVWGGLTQRRHRALFDRFPPGSDPVAVLREAEDLVRRDTGTTAVKTALRQQRRNPVAAGPVQGQAA